MKEFLGQFNISDTEWYGNSGYVSIGKKLVAKVTLGATVIEKYQYGDRKRTVHHGLHMAIIKKGGKMALDSAMFYFRDHLTSPRSRDDDEHYVSACESNSGGVWWQYLNQGWNDSDHNYPKVINGMNDLVGDIDEFIKMSGNGV